MLLLTEISELFQMSAQLQIVAARKVFTPCDSTWVQNARARPELCVCTQEEPQGTRIRVGILKTVKIIWGGHYLFLHSKSTRVALG